MSEGINRCLCGGEAEYHDGAIYCEECPLGVENHELKYSELLEIWNDLPRGADETIQRLRGQLQNCVNHLDRAKRRYNSNTYNECIESANKALYETLGV